MLGVSLLGSRASAVSYDPDDERGKRAVFDLALKVAMAAHSPLFKCEA